MMRRQEIHAVYIYIYKFWDKIIFVRYSFQKSHQNFLKKIKIQLSMANGNKHRMSNIDRHVGSGKSSSFTGLLEVPSAIE